jgi:DNA-binding transcriptional MerR regulator
MKRLTTGDAAKAAGISRATLQTWIAAKTEGLRAPKTQLVEGKAVRLWTPADIKRLRGVKEKVYRKGRGRKPKR